MTLREARKYFNQHIVPTLIHQDPTAIRCAFNDWVDSLEKDGQITENQASTWTHK